MNELADINNDIIEKIDGLEISKIKKDFLKKLLIEEFNHRDKNFYEISNKRNARYEPIIDESFKG